MVEPVAALLAHVLSPARTKNSPAIVAAIKTTCSPSPRKLTQDFFSPTPRRVKGKERADVTQGAESADGDSERVLQCHDWICSTKASSWCSRRHRLLLLREFTPKRERPYLKPPIPHSPRTRHNAHFRPTHHQRRYISRPFSSLPASNRRFEALLQGESPTSSLRTSQLPPEFSEPLEFASQQDFFAYIESLCEAKGKLDLAHAERIYELGSVDDWLLSVPSGVLLQFVGKTLSSVESLYSTRDIDAIQRWGPRLEQLLQRMSSFEAFEQLHARRCLLARALGLNGKSDEAISTIHQALDSLLIGEEETVVALRAYRSLLSSFQVYGGLESMLDFLVKERAFIGAHLLDKPDKKSRRHTEVLRIRKSLYEMLSHANDIILFLDSHQDWTKDTVRSISDVLLSLFLEHRDHRAALSVARFMRSHDLQAGVSDRLLLTRLLACADELPSAQSVFSSVPQLSTRAYLSTALMLAARRGDEERAASYYQHLVDGNFANQEDRAMLLYASAVQAKVDETISQFNAIFPRDSSSPSSKTIRAQPYHHSMVLFAYAQKGDVDGMNLWLERMADEDVPIDTYIYNTVLHSFAKRGDLDSVVSVLKQMRDAGIPPTVITYTMVITLLAHRKDPVGAEGIYKRAIREGIIPDRHLINSLMNAHVEAGSWQGVIRIFDYIRNANSRHLDLTVPIYNTVLKAYILIGSPFPVVAKLFEVLQNSGLRPDEYTFSLLIQSACDAGEMHVARDILRDMRQLRDWDVKVNVYALTILMAGYLRLGDKIRAKEVYDEMRERGINPSAMTYGTILRAYGNERSEESFQIAENFVKTIMGAPKSQRSWNTPSYGKVSALQLIYAPLLAAYSSEQRPDEVERLFQEMLDEGGEPDVGTLTMVMDAYRRTFNIDAVLQIWPQILRAGLALADSGIVLNDVGDSSDPSQVRLKTNILCIPLSIYIDALSSAGRHTEIANVWKQFRSFGFTFDSHNWNHLAVALVRAGEPERAFEVVERVILPYKRQAEKLLSSRSESPASPLALDTPDPNEESRLPSPPSEAPMRKRERRAKAVRIATEKTQGGAAMLSDEITEGDFVHPLFILHRFSPTWNLWRPHSATLSMLLMVLTRLRTGALVDPILPEDATEEAKKEKGKEAHVNVLAAEMLNRIEQNYPETLQLLAQYERQEKRRLKRGFEDAYVY